MIDKNKVLEEILEAMLTEDVEITTRAVVRQSDGLFRHATDITRNEPRRKLVERYAERQKTIRVAIGRSSGKSRTELERLVAAKNVEIQQLQDDRQLLIASHRAMILSVVEMGGSSTWKRFFEAYQSIIDRLESMDSLPKAVVTLLFGPSDA